MNKLIKAAQEDGLEILVREAKKEADSYVVLLHGYGANAYDLFSISDAIDVPDGTAWIFPNAPLLVPFSEYYIGRSWFSFDMERLDWLMRTKRFDDFALQVPSDLLHANQLITKLIKKLPVPSHKIVIGGFSQGAMLATDVALSFDEKLAGLAIFSGSMMNRQAWQANAVRQAGLHFFQSHGTQDPILAIELARQLEKLLQDSQMMGKLQVFEDGHTIPEEILLSFSEFLFQRLV